MRIDLPLRHGRLLRRYKRFLADVRLRDGSVVTAHCPNTGSLLGCTPEGAPAILRDSRSTTRKLRYSLQAVRVGASWVAVDTGLANGLVAEAVLAGALPELAGYESLRREVPFGEKSRIDLLLERGEERCYVEVKSTTLVRAGTAAFPDAVTSRGLRHLVELQRVAAAGQRAVALFVVTRDDAERFAPADDIDPAFGAELRRALAAGVELQAHAARVEPRRIELGRRLPVELGPAPSSPRPRTRARTR